MQHPVGDPSQRLVPVGQIRPQRGRQILSQPPGPGQELQGPARGDVGPVDVVLRRGGEDHRGAHRIHPVQVQLLAEVHAVAQGLGHGLAPVEHLTLVQQGPEGLIEVDPPEVPDHLDEEPGVEQVQDRVLHTAHVLIHRRPVAQRLRVQGGGVQVGVGEAQEVPGGVHEGVHRVRVPPGGLAAGRAGDVDPVLGRGQRGLALGRQLLALQVLRQAHRQLILRDRDLTAVRAVDDGDRRAPEALAGQQPVPQPVDGLAGPCALVLQQLHGAGDRGGLVQSVQRPGAGEHAVPGGGHAADRGVLLPGVHDGAHRQVEGAGEVQIPLVVGRHGHDRPGPVVGQHVVRGPHGHGLPRQRVQRVTTGEHAGLLPVGGLPLDVREGLDPLPVLLQGRPLLVRDQLQGQVRIRGHHQERVAVQGVRAGGEHGDLPLRPAAFGRDPEVHPRTRGAPDPVALHRQDPLRPVPLQLIHVLQQLVRVLGDAEVPLVQGLLGHRGAAALAGAVDDLLVGQHRLVLGAPVDRGVLAVGQAFGVELLEQPLGPAVVLGVRGVQAPGPVHGDPVALEGGRLGLDVAVGPLGRVRAVLDGGVLRGQAEGVPADRVHHVVAALHPVAGDDVAHREGLGVAHVQVPGGVGEHVQDVAAGLGAVVEGDEDPLGLPVLLPAGLQGRGVVGPLLGRLLADCVTHLGHHHSFGSRHRGAGARA
ncbi:Uncharacterised protein [Mycobacteroides abscessus subsp. abscessus]|nr:Uncharacterised protein [Mycobacteroides abscessus subsp. abscessus]